MDRNGGTVSLGFVSFSGCRVLGGVNRGSFCVRNSRCKFSGVRPGRVHCVVMPRMDVGDGAEQQLLDVKDLKRGKLLDATEKTHTASTTGIVQAPVEDVWKLFRQFGSIDKWWTGTYTSMDVSPPGPPVIGQTRSFSIGTNKYREVLIELDDEKNRLSYALDFMEPQILDAAVTTIDFDRMDDNTCSVFWGVQFQAARGITADDIAPRQIAGYNGAIALLNKWFQSDRTTMSVKVLTAHGTIPPCQSLVLSVRSMEQTVAVTKKGTPRNGDEEFDFGLDKLGGDLSLTLLDACGETVASGSIDIHAMTSSEEKKHSVKIFSPGGGEIGVYQIEVGGIQQDDQGEPDVQSANRMPDVIGKLLSTVAKDILGKLTMTSLLIGKEGPWEWASLDSSLGSLPKFTPVLPPTESIKPQRVGDLFERQTEYLYSQVELLKALALMRNDKAAAYKLLLKLSNDDIFQAPFRGYVQAPETLLKTWATDEEFAAQTLRGCNPMMITVAKCKDDLLPEFHELVSDDGRSVEQLLQEKAIYFCNWEDLMVGDLDEKTGAYSHQAFAALLERKLGSMKYWYAPFLVMYRRKSDSKLTVLGFTLTRFTNKKNEVYRQSTHPPVLYRFAKMHVQNADTQHHQFNSHLGMTHLLAEPYAIAAHNVLPKEHVISKLLMPYFQDTIGINFLARQTLISDIAPITDATFSPGTINGVKIFSKAYARYDFFGDNFVNHLKRRGFTEDQDDGLDAYYYRDDGFRLWNVYKRFVGSVVRAHYGTDGAVAQDKDLQAFATEMHSEQKGNVASFPARFDSQALLIETLVSIMFTCSAQHAAVNFPQEDYPIYVPNRPASLHQPMPPTPATGDISPIVIQAAMPKLAAVAFQTFFSFFLSTPPDNPLEMYEGLKREFPEEHYRFIDDLKNLREFIEIRNEELIAKGEIPYEYLNPIQCPTSINI